MAPAVKKQKLSNGTVATLEATAVEETEPAATPKPKAAADEKAEQQRRSLFVRALPPTATSESLTELFSESYPIKHATAVIDAATKQCKGYGFVTFADAEDAQKAKAQFNGHVLDGRKLRVELAERRQREEGGVAKEPKVKPERETQQIPKLIVRNLPWTIKGSNQLEKLFQSYGKVKQAYVPRKGPGLMAGFGFVVMRGRKNAEKAIAGVNGKEVDGRTLAVDWSVEKGVYQGLQQGEEEAEGGAGSVEPDDTETNGFAGSKLPEEDDDQEGHVMDDDAESSAGDEEDDDDDDLDIMVDGEDEEAEGEDTEIRADRPEEKSTTLFVRNLPFTCTDEDLEDHFTRFGSVRYARVVMDFGTERSKGTGFVCFYNTDDADGCIRGAPRRAMPSGAEKGKDAKAAGPSNSILQNDSADPSGQYTLDGRVLQVSRAVDKREASRFTEEGVAHRNKRDTDKRRLYLLSEGGIPSNSPLYDKLSPSEITMREASGKQRKTLIESNPSLNLSLTRLSVRNIPRSIGSKELKALAREGVVGFATDVKAELRNRLSKEELARGGEEMATAEAARKRAGKGLVRQAKVVFEGAGGSKVSEDTGAGRSRGYGFIEYYTHRSALMGLRWLNGHAVGYQVKEAIKGKGKQLSREEVQERKKRLIVEFAIENAQVVLRRNDREHKARERSKAVESGAVPVDNAAKQKRALKKDAMKARGDGGKPGLGKRKRGADGADSSKAGKPVDEKLVKRNQIIGRKRAMRKARSGGKA
ncbi:hypothetical protein LTR36_005365 [Oleoguttula mirabilis]|uniref:RRM domain-containing protein n=1 Tax=Oleoguttula mirabilis TaxID=1507867 RepID=A0AAV9JEV8_9PEZI|nr:hypothetical protein LTR36_005365 [Oleoguttula mirabilis]